MTELLPCWFCGGEAAVCEGGVNGRMRVYGLVEHKDGCFFLADGLPTKYQHIIESDFAAWNTRAERTCRMLVYKCDKDKPWYEQWGTCSVCHELLEGMDNYCPNCGAKVVEE